MNLFKPSPRGHLSGDDLDTLVRWGLRSSVADVQPSDAVWQRIKAGASVRRREERRRPVPMQVARRLVTVSSGVGSVGAGLLSLLRFIRTQVEAYDMQWPEASRPRWAFTPGLLWIMLATDQRIY